MIVYTSKTKLVLHHYTKTRHNFSKLLIRTVVKCKPSTRERGGRIASRATLASTLLPLCTAPRLCLCGRARLVRPTTDLLPAQRTAAEAPTLVAPITLQGAARSNQSCKSRGGTSARCVSMHPKLHVSPSLHLSSQPPCPWLLIRTWLAQIRLRLPSFALLPKIFSVCTISLFHNPWYRLYYVK
jgi:hypothetical protein